MIAVVSVIVIVASFLLRSGGSDGDGSTDHAVDVPTGTTTTPTAQPAALPRAPRSGATTPGDTSTDLPPGFPGEGLTLPPLAPPPGLAGKGGSVGLPKIHVKLEVFSAQPIGIVGWQVPTNPDTPTGVSRGVGTRWSKTIIAYGRPDYARLFFGAGPSGTPVTCVITVNGKVTERRSTDGPYGRTMCQG
ncbi:hypothetical protein GCM10022237_21220 [Nocardioides ginsengisoli]|uniref:Uncharacterized protein n=1 Tax=Nocardioides ginsengisoli TaxID=363868 RepID=A0ABW3W067_9ACTN